MAHLGQDLQEVRRRLDRLAAAPSDPHASGPLIWCSVNQFRPLQVMTGTLGPTTGRQPRRPGGRPPAAGRLTLATTRSFRRRKTRSVRVGDNRVGSEHPGGVQSIQ